MLIHVNNELVFESHAGKYVILVNLSHCKLSDILVINFRSRATQRNLAWLVQEAALYEKMDFRCDLNL